MKYPLKKILKSVVVCAFLSVNSYAQSGPGGVGNSSSNVLWLKAEDLSSLVDGDDINLWQDASGNGNDVSQPTASFTPIYKTGILNGFPVVRFEKTNGRLRKTSFSSFPTTEITAIYVNKTTESNDGVLSYASSAHNNDFLLFSSNNLGLYRSSSSYSSVGFNDNNFHITNASWQSAGGNVEIWKDGSRDYTSSVSSGSTITAGGSLAIAGEQDSVDGNYDAAQAHFGDFTEVMVFDTFLNQAQQIIVANYLGAKYGISISNDRYGYQSTHFYDVAGIGRENATNTHLSAMSAGILQIENASEINADQEYLLFGHNNADISSSWTTLEAPNGGVDIQRLAREWRLDETGTVGTIDVVIDVATLPSLPAGHSMYALMVDADGDFSSGASVYEMIFVSGTNYTTTSLTFTDGDFLAIAAVSPKVQHTTSSGSGAESSNAIIEVSLNFIPVIDKTVEITTANVSAIAGSDYTAVTASTITILAGNTTANYSVIVTDDIDPESTETFVTTLSNPISGLTLGANTMYTHSISDNDISRKVYFDNAASNAAESTTAVTVNLSVDVVDMVNPTSVEYAVTGGTATSGTDYTFSSGTVTFPVGITTGSFSFLVNNDALYETNETIIIGLSNPVNCNLDSSVPFGGTGFTAYTYTINDNDANPTLAFNSSFSVGSESATTVNVAVDLSIVSGIDASAVYTVTGTATGSGFDYTLANGTITIPSGSTTATITAVIHDDNEVELAETLILSLSTPTNASLGTNTSHAYTIIDNDNFGYTGPGGVGDGTTNIVWLDANEISSLLDNDDVTSWSDVSGNSNDFSQSATFSPVYKTSIINGFPIARFNKTNNRIRKTSFTGFASSAITTIFVNKNNGESSDSHVSYASSVHDNDFLLFGSSNLEVYRGSASTSTGVSLNDNNWHIINASWQSSGGNYEIWKDGNESATGTIASGTSITAGGTLALAGEQDAVDGNYASNQAHSGDYPEVIVYNVYLNTAQQIIVSNYLSAKYNIAISNDFYMQDETGNGDFDYNVAGIGMAVDGSFHADSRGNGIVRMLLPASLSSDKYLFWGRNNRTNYSFVTNTSNYKERLSSNWRVNKRNNLGTITFEIDMTGIDLSSKNACAPLQLIVDNDSDLLSPTSAYTLINTTGNIYQATGVSFNDGDYFTVEYLDKIVVDDTQYYNGSGTGNVPNTTDSCYKLLVKNTATGAISLTENASVREIEIESGGKLALNTGVYLQVENGINNDGEIRLVGTSQLIQTHTTATQVSGTGVLYKDRAAVTTNVFQSGFWSSPVTSNGSAFTINSILKDGTIPTAAVATAGAASDITFTGTDILDGSNSPVVISGRWLAKLINDVDWTREISPTSQSFNPVEGWNMKSVAGDFTFKGIPNDGIYTTSIDQNKLSLIGNPYPSAIDADQFIADNAAAFNGVLYFYNSSGDVSHSRSAYSGTYYTRVNGVGTPAETTAISGSNYYIPIGQAFFVTREASGSGSITFKNTQRSFKAIGSESVFFSKNKTETSKKIPVIRLGFHFNIEGGQVFNRELAIAFRGLTNNYDVGFDAEMFDKQPSDLALKIEDKTAPFVISSVDYLNEEMEIPLYLYLDMERTVTFKLSALEHMNASVYIYDKVTKQTYKINDSSVSLSLPAGTYVDRFVLIFQDRTEITLGVEDEIIENKFRLYFDANSREIVLKTTEVDAVKAVKIFSIFGQEIMNLKRDILPANELRIGTDKLSSSVYIVKVYFTNGIASRKIIIH